MDSAVVVAVIGAAGVVLAAFIARNEGARETIVNFFVNVVEPILDPPDRAAPGDEPVSPKPLPPPGQSPAPQLPPTAPVGQPPRLEDAPHRPQLTSPSSKLLDQGKRTPHQHG